MARATMSVPPPGANGTSIRTGLFGYFCAAAWPAARPSAAAMAIVSARAAGFMSTPGRGIRRSLAFRVRVHSDGHLDIEQRRVLLCTVHVGVADRPGRDAA